MRKLSLIFVAIAAVIAAALVAAPSHATFRGSNGLLVYQKAVSNENDIQLFTIRSDGSHEKQITHFHDSAATNANWSADGSRIVFTRHWQPGGGPGEKFELYTVNANGTGLKALPQPGQFVLGPNWTPDGHRIIFTQGKTNSIAMINADGTGLRNRIVPGYGGDSVCVFTDGKRIAFLRSKSPNSDTTAVFVAGISGKGLKRITPWGTYADKIDCSPDGTRVAYSAPGFDNGASNVYTVRSDGTHRVQLTHATDKAINNGLDSWSPDGKKIVFISNRDEITYQLYLLNAADGSGVTQLTHGAEAHLASWGSHP